MYKINNSLRSSLLLGAATAAAIALTGSAIAQNVETVVVTGSRIPQPSLVSTSPVTVVGQQEMQLEGATNVENLLNNLPSVVADYTNTASNGATGQATVDLRGLGSSRTLVLVDGKRLMPSDPSNPVADLNQIPAALVDHVEVLTGGASAVYGSDAEAGVVNFVMRKDFEGIELNSQLGINQSDNQNGADRARQIASGIATAPENFWGGRNLDFSVLLGVNTPDGKGNITAYVGYRSIDPVTQKNMDFSACALATSGGSLRCYGSSNGNRWISIDGASAGAPGANWDYYETGTGKAGSGNFVTWGSTANERYNFAAANYIQRPDTRYIAGYDAHYEVAPWATVYSNMMFADDHTLAQIAPSGLFLGTGRNLSINGIAGQKTAYVEVNCNNPLMTAQENQALCGNILPTTPFGSGTMLAKYGASGPYGTGYDQLVGGLWNGAANMYPGQSLWKSAVAISKAATASTICATPPIVWCLA